MLKIKQFSKEKKEADAVTQHEMDFQKKKKKKSDNPSKEGSYTSIPSVRQYCVYALFLSAESWIATINTAK